MTHPTMASSTCAQELIHTMPRGDSIRHEQNVECPCGAELDEELGYVRHRRVNPGSVDEGCRTLIPLSRCPPTAEVLTRILGPRRE